MCAASIFYLLWNIEQKKMILNKIKKNIGIMCMKNVKHFALCLPDIHNSRWFFIFHVVFDFFPFWMFLSSIILFYYYNFICCKHSKERKIKKTLKCKRKRNILLTVVNNDNNTNKKYCFCWCIAYFIHKYLILWIQILCERLLQNSWKWSGLVCVKGLF